MQTSIDMSPPGIAFTSSFFFWGEATSLKFDYRNICAIIKILIINLFYFPNYRMRYLREKKRKEKKKGKNTIKKDVHSDTLWVSHTYLIYAPTPKKESRSRSSGESSKVYERPEIYNCLLLHQLPTKNFRPRLRPSDPSPGQPNRVTHRCNQISPIDCQAPRAGVLSLKWAVEASILAIPVEMQPNLFPFGSAFGNPFLFNGDLSEGFEGSRFFLLLPFLLLQGGGDGMDLSKVGEKILSSVRSARSLGLLPSASASDRPEVIIPPLIPPLSFLSAARNAAAACSSLNSVNFGFLIFPCKREKKKKNTRWSC